jgi:hypothetical protein
MQRLDMLRRMFLVERTLHFIRLYGAVGDMCRQSSVELFRKEQQRSMLASLCPFRLISQTDGWQAES